MSEKLLCEILHDLELVRFELHHLNELFNIFMIEKFHGRPVVYKSIEQAINNTIKNFHEIEKNFESEVYTEV